MQEQNLPHTHTDHHKRNVLIGLSGRLKDRSVLNSLLSNPETLPVAVIEDIENKKEVQEFIKSVPNWKPMIRYFSQNPIVKNRYPALTPDLLNDFLSQNKIDTCIVSLTDHETDRFVHQYPHTKTAQKIAARTQIEADIAAVTQAYNTLDDSPTLFYALEADRLKELKNEIYQNLNQIQSSAVDQTVLKEAFLFTRYLTESLDGRNLEFINAQKATHTEENENPTAATETKAPRKATVMLQELTDFVKKEADVIMRGTMWENDKSTPYKIRAAVKRMQEKLPEIKKLHHKTQSELYLYFKRGAELLEMAANRPDLKSSTQRLYKELSEKLTQMSLSNGEKEMRRIFKKSQQQIAEEIKQREAIQQAQLREQQKTQAREEQHNRNIIRLLNRTPEEIEQARQEKLARQAANRARKAMKVQQKKANQR